MGKAAKDLHEEMEGIAKIVTQLRDLEKAGLLSPAAVMDRRSSMLVGMKSRPK